MNTQKQVDFSKIGFTDDFMFCSVMEDEGRCKEFLERVLGFEIAEITLVQKQWTEQNHYANKGIRLDVYVKDVEGNAYDIEMQTVRATDLAKRCRYYHSEMDGYLIRKGFKYNSLKSSIVIFVCTYDPYGYDESIYSFEKMCKEHPELCFNDEQHTIILNTKGKREGLSKGLKDLLDYIENGQIKDEFTKRLQNEVEKLRNDADWRERYMTLEMKMDEKYEQGLAAGREEGDVQRLTKQVQIKLAKGKKLSVIADECEEDESVIEEIIASLDH